MVFRNLNENEIKCRIQQVTKKGVRLLLYKDARVDMEILDETLGAENWQCKYTEYKGNLFCSIGINVNYDKPDEPEKWVWKEDAGAESNIEQEKGEASDAFKRAAFRWSLGRSLYTTPDLFVWETNKKGEVQCKLEHSEDGKRTYCNDKFYVERIKYSEDGKRIVAISIMNDTLKKRCLVWQKEDEQ